VFREGLLEVRRLRVGARPLEPLQDIAAIIGVPAVEVSYSSLELTYIGRAAAPQRERPRRSVVLHPVVGTRERIEQLLQVDVPVTQLEVEVMGTIVGG